MPEQSLPTAFDPAKMFAELEAFCRLLNPRLENIRVVYGGGGVIEGVLPVPIIAPPAVSEPEDDPADDLTPKQKAILQVVDEMKIGDVMSNDQIAGAAGYANSSDLRTFVKALMTAGRLKPHRYGAERIK